MTIYNIASFLVGGGAHPKKIDKQKRTKSKKGSILYLNLIKIFAARKSGGMACPVPFQVPPPTPMLLEELVLLPDLSGFGFSFYRMFRKHGKGRVTKIENKWSVKKLVKILS